MHCRADQRQSRRCSSSWGSHVTIRLASIWVFCVIALLATTPLTDGRQLETEGEWFVYLNEDPIDDSTSAYAARLSEPGSFFGEFGAAALLFGCLDGNDRVLVGVLWNVFDLFRIGFLGMDVPVQDVDFGPVTYRFPPADAETEQWLVSGVDLVDEVGFAILLDAGSFLRRLIRNERLVVRGEPGTAQFDLGGIRRPLARVSDAGGWSFDGATETGVRVDAGRAAAEASLDRSARRRVQQRLRDYGFDPGAPDGLFGPRTRAAIRDWQRSRGVSATGYLNGDQVLELVASVELLRVESSPPVAPPPLVEPRPPADLVDMRSVASSLSPASDISLGNDGDVTGSAFFTRGSHADDVLRIQGTPTGIDTYGDSEVWRYGLSSVTISTRSREVTEWSDSGGDLHVRLQP